MSEEEKNLVERDYEGEERTKMMVEINKRFDEMEAKMNSKLEGMNSRIEEINSELQGLRERLFNRFSEGWRDKATEYQRRELESLKSNKRNLEYYSGINYKFREEHQDEIAKMEAKIKALEEEINKVYRTKFYF